VAQARNCAIAEAQGQFIAPLDADDLWHPEKIERQLAAIRQSPRIGCVTTWFCTLDEESRVLWKPEDGVGWTGYVLPALVLENFAGCASSPLMRRECVLKAGGYDPDLYARNAQGCEDWKLLLTIARHSDLAVLALPLTGYRQTPDGMSENYWSMLRSYDLVMSEIMQQCPEIPAKVFRWSRSNMCEWLGGRARRSGAHFDAMHLYSLAIRSNWVFGLEMLTRAALRVSTMMMPRGRSEDAQPTYPDLIGLSASAPRRSLTERLIERRRRYIRHYVGTLLAGQEQIRHPGFSDVPLTPRHEKAP